MLMRMLLKRGVAELSGIAYGVMGLLSKEDTAQTAHALLVRHSRIQITLSMYNRLAGIRAIQTGLRRMKNALVERQRGQVLRGTKVVIGDGIGTHAATKRRKAYDV